MSKYLFSVSSLLLFFNVTIAQKKANLTITNVFKKSKFELTVKYEIIGKDSSIFYKISNSSFCEGLATLEVMDKKKHKTGFYDPCTATLQLADVIFTERNSFKINPSWHYQGYVNVDTRKMDVKLLKNRTYSITLSFNFNNIESGTNILYYKQRLISDPYKIHY